MLWPLGKTPFLILMLCLLFFSGWSSGFQAVFFYGVIACLERLLKLLLKRQRPFSVLPAVRVLQAKQPHDPSHPSGDAMRIWYLAIVIPVAFSLPLSILLIFCLIAALVSLGRIAFGVHFPLDVIGGVGLGLLGAGLYLLLF
ncbi:MAG: phosphatase PAP2 family protein [Desulfuromusa sp.]|nr:phosphatase PAP2 family protein [Desulfuromusa sp.]